MKVLFIQKMAGISGSELYLLKIMPLLRQQGVDCSFLSISKPEDVEASQRFIKVITDAGVPCYKLETKSEISLKLIKEIYRVYKNGSFDIIHTHLIHADFWGACVKMIFDRKLKLISSKHGYDEAYQAAFGFDHTKKRFDKYYLTALFAEKFVNRSAAISEGLRNFYVGMGISPESKIETVLYGLDFSEEVKKLEPANCRFFAKQLLIVGRLIPYKGQKLVISCMPDLLKKFPDVGLVLVGRGESDAELKNQVKELNLEQHVRFEGLRTNVHSYFAQSDIVLVPSRSEGFGIVILEGWYHSKPVVAFDVPSPNTIIKQNQTGMLITPFDTHELTEKLEYLLQHPEEQKRLGEAGKKSLSTTYSENNMVLSTINLYKKVLAN